MPKLLVCPPHKGEPYSFQLQGKEIRIGRSSANDLVLADPCCSPSHALISPFKTGYAIRDLGSRNGTQVNGDRISEETALKKDDDITVGATRLVFDCEIVMPPPQPKWWPKTVEEAADHILSRMDAQNKDTVRKTKRGNLILYHHDWGTGIRNAFGLWIGNNALLESSGCTHPDECSMKIIERVWQKLQKE